MKDRDIAVGLILLWLLWPRKEPAAVITYGFDWAGPGPFQDLPVPTIPALPPIEQQPILW